MPRTCKVHVCRHLDDYSEGFQTAAMHAAEFHVLRARALHDIFDEDPVCEVVSWGDTDDVKSHEWVELVVKFRELAADIAPVTIPAMLYIGKVLLDAGISATAAEGIKRILSMGRKKQQDGSIRDMNFTLHNGTNIFSHPESPAIEIQTKTSVSISLDLTTEQIQQLQTAPTETIEVPKSLAPRVRQFIDKHRLDS